MKRFFCAALLALSVGTLWNIYALWGTLEGQAAYRILAPVNAGLNAVIQRTADELQARATAYALTQTSVECGGKSIPDVLAYECIAFDVNGLGIAITDGVPPGASGALVSEALALTISPSLECVGLEIWVGESRYRIAGVYHELTALRALTSFADKSVIVPASESTDARNVYVWLGEKDASGFLFERGARAIGALTNMKDAFGVQGRDIHSEYMAGRQLVRLFVLACLAIVCVSMWKRLRGMRKRFRTDARRAFERYYPARALVRLVVPFSKYILLSLIFIAIVALYAAHCMQQLYIAPGSMPNMFLRMDAWRTLLTDNVVAQNTTDNIYVFGCAFASRLTQLTWVSGTCAVVFLRQCFKSHNRNGGV